jgi:hypothetical protein
MANPFLTSAGYLPLERPGIVNVGFVVSMVTLGKVFLCQLPSLLVCHQVLVK